MWGKANAPLTAPPLSMFLLARVLEEVFQHGYSKNLIVAATAKWDRQEVMRAMNAQEQESVLVSLRQRVTACRDSQRGGKRLKVQAQAQAQTLSTVPLTTAP